MTNRRNNSQSDQGLSEDMITKICKQQTESISKHLDGKFAKMDQAINMFMEKVNENCKKIDKLEVTQDENEQQARLNNLRIYGIPEPENETQEQTEHQLLKMFKNKLKLDIKTSDIDRCYRIGVHKRDITRPIFVRFISFKNRSSVFQNKKMLKNTGFVIKEDLTRIRSSLLKKAVEKYGTKNVWTQNGKVFYSSNNRKCVINPGDEL